MAAGIASCYKSYRFRKKFQKKENPGTLLKDLERRPMSQAVIVEAAAVEMEEPALVDDPSYPDSELSDEEEDDEETSSSLLYGALHGLEPLEPGAEPRQRIGTSKCGISKKSWTKAEDAILTNIVTNNGAHRWSNVAAQLPGRAGKQCRERCAKEPRSKMIALDPGCKTPRTDVPRRVSQLVQPSLPRGEEGLVERGGGPHHHGFCCALRNALVKDCEAHAGPHRQRHQEPVRAEEWLSAIHHLLPQPTRPPTALRTALLPLSSSGTTLLRGGRSVSSG